MQRGNSSETSSLVAHKDRNIDEVESEISNDEQQTEVWERAKNMFLATEPAHSDKEEEEEEWGEGGGGEGGGGEGGGGAEGGGGEGGGGGLNHQKLIK